jgi:hypothetical protein
MGLVRRSSVASGDVLTHRGASRPPGGAGPAARSRRVSQRARSRPGLRPAAGLGVGVVGGPQRPDRVGDRAGRIGAARETHRRELSVGVPQKQESSSRAQRHTRPPADNSPSRELTSAGDVHYVAVSRGFVTRRVHLQKPYGRGVLRDGDHPSGPATAIPPLRRLRASLPLEGSRGGRV